MKMSEILEAPQSKISAMKPGVSAEIDHGDGTKTTVDLKKNPTALDKDETGKVKLNTKPKPGASKDPKKMIKPGDNVEVD